MTDITLEPIRSGYNLQKMNDNFEKIEDNINNTSIQSTGDNNVMLQDFDMNSNQILNLPDPVLPLDVVRLKDLPFYDLSNLALNPVEELVELSSGQVDVTLTSTSTLYSAFYIGSTDVDRGRLISGVDYNVTSDTTLTLTNSYPEGTTLTVVKNDISSGSVGEVNSVFGRAGIILASSGDYSADQVDYDNTTSGLSATDVEGAIDELSSSVDVLQADNANNQTGTSYTLQVGDENKTIWMTNASANTVTIPLNSSEAFAIGTVIMIMMEGAGITTLSATSGVLLNGVNAGSGELTQYTGVTIVKRGTDVWVATPITVA